MNNDININLPVGGVVTYQPTGIGGMEVTVTVPPGPPAFAPRATPLTIPITVGVKEPEAKPAPSIPDSVVAEMGVDAIVSIANSLPQEVLGEFANAGSFNRDGAFICGNYEFGRGFFTHSLPYFRRNIVGAMAEYIATETYARVHRIEHPSSRDRYEWSTGRGVSGHCYGQVAAMAACCKSIAASRKAKEVAF